MKIIPSPAGRDSAKVCACPRRQLKAKDASTRAVALVNKATGSEPVNGEDLLPPRLAKRLREAKKRTESAKL